MTVERARIRVVPKPWGRPDLRPWSEAGRDGHKIGELWFERPGSHAPEPSLLLKLLFTSEPLSIQVHPDDAFARSLGLPRGKSEAWYVLSAASDARVAIGLSRTVSPSELRSSIVDGSVDALVQWRDVQTHDTISVPAGTIHALGAGLVVAELQQRSDTTFRLFDFGRRRDLHTDKAIAAADLGPAKAAAAVRRLTDTRSLLVASPAFVFERIELPPGSRWTIGAPAETWLLVIGGSIGIGPDRILVGEAVFLEDECVSAEASIAGTIALVGYLANEPFDALLTALVGTGLPPDGVAPVPYSSKDHA